MNPIRLFRSFSRNARLFMAGSFLMGLGHGCLWVHMNLYLRGAGIGEAMIGQILAANSLGTVLVSIPAALWIDRFPARSVFLLAAAGFAACFGIQVLFPYPLTLFLASFATGMLFTIHWVAAAPFFVRNSTPKERTELFSWSSGVETAATILSAYGAGVAASWIGGEAGSETTGLRWALLGVAALTALAVIPFSAIRGRPLESERRSLREYVMARDFGLLGRICLPGFLVGCGAGLTIPFLNLYFRDRFGQDPRQIGGFFAVAQILMMLGFFAGPLLARRIGHVRAVVATELLSIPFFLVMALTDHLVLAVVAFWMRGALMNMNGPISSAFAMEIVPSDQQAATNSMRMLAWNLSWMLTSATGGWLVENRGYTGNMLGTIVFYLAASSLWWIFFRNVRIPIPKEDGIPTS